MAYRKYKRTFRRRRPFSGRRMGRTRRFGRKRRRQTSWTMQTGTGRGIQYRSRMLRRRTYRKMLWKDTMFKDHWRSANTVVQTLSTPVDNTSMQLVWKYPLTDTLTDANAFWTVGGGCIEKDLNKGVPLFRGITIRGGVIRVKVALPITDIPSVNDVYVCKIWILWTNAAPNTAANIPSTAVDVSWDPSFMTDVDTEVGKTVLYKEFTMSANINPTVQVEYRLRCQKIDMDAFAFSNGKQPLVIVGCGPITNTTGIDIGVFTEHNLSFAGDAVQPPPTALADELDKVKAFVHYKEDPSVSFVNNIGKLFN